MRKQRDDLTGQDFGYLHVDGEAYVRKRESGGNVYYWGNVNFSVFNNQL